MGGDNSAGRRAPGLDKAATHLEQVGDSYSTFVTQSVERGGQRRDNGALRREPHGLQGLGHGQDVKIHHAFAEHVFAVARQIHRRQHLPVAQARRKRGT